MNEKRLVILIEFEKSRKKWEGGGGNKRLREGMNETWKSASWAINHQHTLQTTITETIEGGHQYTTNFSSKCYFFFFYVIIFK